MEGYRQKVIIDTDLGDDIDDAFALAMAVRSDELELMGITTVYQNSSLRAKMVRALLASFGREDIPVCAGMDMMLMQDFVSRAEDRFGVDGKLIPCQYEESMGKFTFEKEWGPDFIIRSVLEHPGDITLIPIGALTNIAVAIRKCPEVVSKIKRIVLMGGAFHEDFPEWNILCDPEAARIVFTSGVEIYAVGLDVTLKCRLRPEHTKRLGASGAEKSEVLSGMLEKWSGFAQSNPILHDPLTVGCVIDSTFVRFRQREVLVELNGENRGKTRILEEPQKGSSRIWVAEAVDSKRYLEFFCDRIFSQ